MKKILHPTLANTIANLDLASISNARKELLKPLISYIKSKQKKKETINLYFICTHNSRRSQFSQLWAQTAAYHYGIAVNCFSGGTKITSFNKQALNSIKRAGFIASVQGKINPKCTISFAKNAPPIIMFSKLFNNNSSPSSNFAAIITCSHADKNCPAISRIEAKFPLLYEDPKAFDYTSKEAEMYDKCSLQIGTEFFYVFSKIKNFLNNDN